MVSEIQKKRDNLLNTLSSYDALAVAFSGGVDSTLLLAAAKSVLGDRVVAFSIASVLNPESEHENAVILAEMLGSRLVWIKTKVLEDPAFLINDLNRCYICKKHLFAAIKKKAAGLGIDMVAHGANVDDLKVFRPGNKAAQQYRIAAPLVDAKLNKSDVRALSRLMGLPTWNRPAMSCLATRLPYGTAISEALLEMVARAEAVVSGLGFTDFRVRHHGPIARVEVLPDAFDRIMRAGIRTEIVEQLRAIGYTHVTIDLEGYISGKMDRTINEKNGRRTR